MLIKRHPQQGARVVSSLDGYGPVAEIILAHHERIDGKGYPRGLDGRRHPRAGADHLRRRHLRRDDRARLLPDADVQLRRDRRSCAASPASSSTPRFVEIFIELLEGKDVSFRHGEAADFEKELALEVADRRDRQPRRRARTASRSPASPVG